MSARGGRRGLALLLALAGGAGCGDDGDGGAADDAGAVDATVEVSDEIRPGVVSLPHGWGHDRAGIQLDVARRHAGASINDLTDEMRLDALTGNAAFSGVPVRVEAAATGEER